MEEDIEIQKGLEDVKAGRVKPIKEVAKNYRIKLKDNSSKNRP